MAPVHRPRREFLQAGDAALDGAASLRRRRRLESSTSQQERHESLAAYIGGVDEPRTNFGAWMATACLFVFLLSMVNELRGDATPGVAVAALPAGRRTELSSAEDGDNDGGTISLLRISHARRGSR